MQRELALPAISPQTLSSKVGSSYPSEFKDPVKRRHKRSLGDALGLTHYGVNLVELPPGAWSSQRHWHTREDEFVYVVEGELTLVTENGEQVLGAGEAAGFPAGEADGHHLINRGSKSAVYLEVGDRISEDEVNYPDIDLVLKCTREGKVFSNKAGEPYGVPVV